MHRSIHYLFISIRHVPFYRRPIVVVVIVKVLLLLLQSSETTRTATRCALPPRISLYIYTYSVVINICYYCVSCCYYYNVFFSFLTRAPAPPPAREIDAYLWRIVVIAVTCYRVQSSRSAVDYRGNAYVVVLIIRCEKLTTTTTTWTSALRR